MLAKDKLQPGDKIKMKVPALAADDWKRRVETVTVIKQYPHHVLVERGTGRRFCVTNADLYVARMAEENVSKKKRC